MNQVIDTIKNRRSVRNYLPDQIKKEELDQIIEAAIFAPSAHNEQPWHFTVIQNRELMEYINTECKLKMAESDVRWIRVMGNSKKFNISYGAPTLVIVSGNSNAVSWMPDCSAAVQNMLIAAESLDIGSIWLGLVSFFFNEEECKNLKLPEGYVPICGVALGYKTGEPRKGAPKRNYDVVNYIP